MTYKELEKILEKAIVLLEDDNKNIEFENERLKASIELYKKYNEAIVAELGKC